MLSTFLVQKAQVTCEVFHVNILKAQATCEVFQATCEVLHVNIFLYNFKSK